MTAVEWLVEELNQKIHIIPMDKWDMIRDLVQKAKEMEKQQKATYWQEGYDSCEFHNDYDELQKEPINNPYRK